MLKFDRHEHGRAPLNDYRARANRQSCLSRILRLATPDIPEAILAGRADQSLMLDQLELPLPASWAEQHARIAEPKMS
jgi:hypothetical protein